MSIKLLRAEQADGATQAAQKTRDMEDVLICCISKYFLPTAAL